MSLIAIVDLLVDAWIVKEFELREAVPNYCCTLSFCTGYGADLAANNTQLGNSF